MIKLHHQIPAGLTYACKCFKGDENSSQTSEQLIQQQSTAGAGGAAIGANSNHNIVNITTSDVNALIANQNVSESAISAEGSTAAYAIEALEQSSANQNIVLGTAIAEAASEAHDSENVASTVASNDQSIASQVIAGAGYGGQQTFSGPVSDSDQASASGTISLNNWYLVFGIVASIATVYYLYKTHGKA